MSYQRLMDLVEADDKAKARNQDNVPPVSPNVNEDSSNDSKVEDTVIDTTKDNENETDVKPNSETSQEDQAKKVEQEKIKKSELTDKQKQEYAFKKQLAIKEKKHADELALMKREIEALKQSTKKPDPIVDRENFATDAEYIAYKAREEAQKVFNEAQKANEQKNEESNRIAQRSVEVKNKVDTLFTTPEDKKLYTDMVQHAVDVGLGDFLNSENKERTIMTFIDNSPIGPKILQHLIGFPDKLKEIYETTDIMDKKVELKLLERELRYEMKTPPAKEKEKTPQPKPVVIGKLGSQTNNPSRSSREDDAEAMRLIRGY